jgi:hypothetical protein
MTGAMSVLAAGVALGQSTDMTSPTRMVSNEIKGVGEQAERQYYYSFVGGPGEIVVVLDARSSAEAHFQLVNVDLLDTSFKKLLNVSGNTGQQIERVTVPRSQKLILQVTVPAALPSYRVRVTGAAQFGDAPSAPAGRAAPATTAAPAESRLGCIPRAGILRVEMEDGSAQEINLARAKRVFVK